MKKLIFSLLFIGLIVPFAVKADIVSDLQAQINALLQQIQALQAQLAAQQTTIPTTPTPTTIITSCPNLTYNLYLGLSDSQTGGQVSILQEFLAQDSSIYPEGEITGYFGPATERAVQRWQAKNNIVSSGTPNTTGFGSVGPRTRTAISAICRTSILPTGAATTTTATTATTTATTTSGTPTLTPTLTPTPTPDQTPAKATETPSSSVSSTSLEGDLITTITEDFVNERPTVRHHLKKTDKSDGEETIEILGGNEETKRKLPSGSKVRVSGNRQGKTLALSAESSSLQTITTKGAPSYGAAPSSLANGVKKVAIFFAKFQGDTGESYATVTKTQKTLNRVKEYYSENSYGKISFEFTIYEGWRQLPSQSCANRWNYLINSSRSFWDIVSPTFPINDFQGVIFIVDQGLCSAINAAVIGQDKIIAYNQLNYAVPNSYHYLGLAVLDDRDNFYGFNEGAHKDIDLNDPSSFFNSGVGATAFKDFSHELGHTLGLRHANFMNCGDNALANSGCASQEYKDAFDMMGANNSGNHFSAAKKDALGWFSSSDTLTINPSNVTTAQTFTLKPIENSAAGLKAVKITRDSSSSYYLEYRQPIGYDIALQYWINLAPPFYTGGVPPNIAKGVSLRIAPMVFSGVGGDSQLIDLAPTTSMDWTTDRTSPALEPGRTFNFPGIDLTLEVLSASADGATARIYKTSSGRPPISATTNAAPTANAGPDQTVNENTLVTLQGSGSDPDTNPITYKWTAPAGITLSNSQTANPTFTSPSVSADANYTFTLVVNDGTLDSSSDSVVITVRNVSVPTTPTTPSFNISLKQDWNFISLPYEPVNPAIERVLESISGKYSIVRLWDEGGTPHTYSPDLASFLSDLKEMHSGYGYEIKMTQDAILTNQGTVSSSVLPTLRTGWNWIGISSLTSQNISSLVDTSRIITLYSINPGSAVISEQGQPHWPQDFTQFEPGKGYILKLNSPSASGAFFNQMASVLEGMREILENLRNLLR